MEKVVPGCWIDTRFGRAVAIEVVDVCEIKTDFGQKEVLEPWVSFRYRAIRYSDGKEIWVLNSQGLSSVKFLGEPTRFTMKILDLSGPYGV